MQCSGSAQVCRPHGYGGFYLCSLVSALLCSTGDHPLEKRGHRQKKHVPAGHHSLAEIREPLRESAGASEGEGGQQLGWSPSPSEGPPMEPGSEGGGAPDGRPLSAIVVTVLVASSFCVILAASKGIRGIRYFPPIAPHSRQALELRM